MKLVSAFFVALLLICTAPFSAVAFEDEPGARQIMQSVRDRDNGDNAVMEQEMILIDKRGNQRVRKIKSFLKEFGDDTYSILFFVEPADVRNTSFLTYDYMDSGKEDDQWLYLPALNRVRRIAKADKSGSFMGSDFTYGDMTRADLDKFKYRLLRELEIEGKKHWLVESMPVNDDVAKEYGYTVVQAAVRQDDLIITRARFELDKAGMARYFMVHKSEVIQGISTVTESSMTTKRNDATQHQTLLRLTSIQYDQDLPDDLFTTTRMERGL